MSRRARWRSSPDEPKIAITVVVRWMADQARLHGSHYAVHLVRGQLLFAIQVALPMFLLAVSWAFIDGWLGYTVGILAAPLPGLIWRLLYRRRLGRFEALLPSPLPPDTFPVYIATHYHSALTGLDEAAASFGDGWLHIEGDLTSFSLRVGDGRTVRKGDTVRIAFPDGRRITVWQATDRNLEYERKDFSETARRWIARAERPAGESILPPFGTLPRIRRGYRLIVSVATVVWFSGASLFALREIQGPWVAAFSFVLLAPIMRGIFVMSEHAAADRQAKALETSDAP